MGRSGGRGAGALLDIGFLGTPRTRQGAAPHRLRERAVERSEAGNVGVARVGGRRAAAEDGAGAEAGGPAKGPLLVVDDESVAGVDAGGSARAVLRPSLHLRFSKDSFLIA